MQLFFVISGLSLCLSAESRGLGERFSKWEFWKRRIVRVYPLFAIATLFYFFLNNQIGRVWYAGPQVADYLGLLSTLTLTHGLTPEWINWVVPGGWAISIETMFYLIFPWLWKKVRSLNAATIWFLVTLITSRGLTILLHPLPYPNSLLWGEYLYYYLPAQLPIFLLGIVVYWAIREKRWPKILMSALPLLLVAGIWKPSLMPAFVWWGIGWSSLILLLNKRTWVGIDNRVMRQLGNVSYEMYLVHSAVYMGIVGLGLFQLSGNAGVDAILRYGMAIAGSLGVAAGIRALISR